MVLRINNENGAANNFHRWSEIADLRTAMYHANVVTSPACNSRCIRRISKCGYTKLNTTNTYRKGLWCWFQTQKHALIPYLRTCGNISWLVCLQDSTQVLRNFLIFSLSSGPSRGPPMWISISRKRATWAFISKTNCKHKQKCNTTWASLIAVISRFRQRTCIRTMGSLCRFNETKQTDNSIFSWNKAL